MNAPVTEEVDVIDLDVQGHLPHYLDGLYLRNGPNPQTCPTSTSSDTVAGFSPWPNPPAPSG
ncbi:carotenoid oxygenase family protein [Streptomyces mirabilis]|uniref:carotenoid oxygenase family protein n=1 Tax=Streptomyces mirabilis TaxID=68239 RepID=UPI003441305E